jgi:outer membrane protein OmpA-like peptidoglycan-associated protein
MASGRGSSVRGTDGASRPPLGPAALALLVALGACNPIATYRDMRGISKDDPNPATTPNGKNLAAGTASPYPNLATVPPPPTEELTTAELQHLTQSLVADRANAKYSDQQLRAGVAEAGESPPPSAPAATATGAPANAASGAARAAAAPPAAAPKAAAPIAPPAAAGVVAAASPAPPSRAATGAAQAGGSTTETGKPAHAAAPGVPPGMESGLRKPGQPPEPGPMESSLVAPQIPETPQPAQPQPAPPPPRLVGGPANGGGAAHLLPPPAAAPTPAAIGSVAYQPPPPPPVLASPVPARTAMAAPAGKKPVPPPPVATPVAEIAFAAGSGTLSDDDLAALDKVAALYRRNPGNLRIVGYAPVNAGSKDPMNGFRTALDHAHAVAAALAKTGIPTDKIAVEASPATAAEGGDRAEVLLVH